MNEKEPTTKEIMKSLTIEAISYIDSGRPHTAKEVLENLLQMIEIMKEGE